MKFVIILLIIWFAFWLFRPWIKRTVGAWMRRRAEKIMMNRMEDMMRSAAGMPPRDKHQEKRDEKRRERREKGKSWSSPPPHREYRPRHAPLIPKEYAVDVEYTEYKEYSSQTKISEDDGRIEWHQEEQVSDVEWVEIKDK